MGCQEKGTPSIIARRKTCTRARLSQMAGFTAIVGSCSHGSVNELLNGFHMAAEKGDLQVLSLLQPSTYFYVFLTVRTFRDTLGVLRTKDLDSLVQTVRNHGLLRSFSMRHALCLVMERPLGCSGNPFVKYQFQ